MSDDVGFRTIGTDGTGVVVNGEVTFLRGISMHAEAMSGGRRSHGLDDAVRMFDAAERLGVDFVRLAHYQHDEFMVREADRRGILAWCELPVYWGIAFGGPHVLENARDQLDELVTRDRSRAAVIFWSIANETLPSPERTALIPGTRWSSSFDKPIVFMEMGAGAKAGHHGDADQIWTEEFQAAVYSAQVEMVEANRSDTGGGAVAGMSPWILKDFRAPVRVLPGIQDGYNRKGLLDEEGEPKLAFHVLSSMYSSFR